MKLMAFYCFVYLQKGQFHIVTKHMKNFQNFIKQYLPLLPVMHSDVFWSVPFC